MPRTPKSPQEKKRLSLQKDRRNTYGENAKSSRKNIARNKAKSHRKVRHGSKQDLNAWVERSEEKAEVIESTLKTPRLQKGRWRKAPDSPLGEVIVRKLKRRVADVGARIRRRARKAGQS